MYKTNRSSLSHSHNPSPKYIPSSFVTIRMVNDRSRLAGDVLPTDEYAYIYTEFLLQIPTPIYIATKQQNCRDESDL